MSTPDFRAMAQEERADLLSLLRTLTDAEWEAPSLCFGLSVRDVATHIVSYDELSAPTLIGTFLRGGMKVSSVNAVALRRYRDLEPQAVIALLSRNLAPSGLPAAFGGGIALTDGAIHHQDIRRAPGRRRSIPAHRVGPVLDFALGAPTLPAKKNAKALKLTATDLNWTAGAEQRSADPVKRS